ncbi:MAG: peptidase E [Polyangia bacterium]
MTGHVVAMGGGGFSMEDSPLLDDYVLSLARRANPRVCFVPTASGDAAGYVTRFYRALSGRCVASDLTLNETPGLPRRPRDTSDLAAFVAEQDVFYVGGGNTAHLLALWRVHGLDVLLRGAWRGGAVLAGVSAGMICWFESSVTDSFGALDALNDGLGVLSGSACPHYDGNRRRRPTYHRLVKAGMAAGYAADDSAALHFEGTTLVGAVSSTPGAACYRVSATDGVVTEERLDTRYLG